jgi:hypothetical protein
MSGRQQLAHPREHGSTATAATAAQPDWADMLTLGDQYGRMTATTTLVFVNRTAMDICQLLWARDNQDIAGYKTVLLSVGTKDLCTYPLIWQVMEGITRMYNLTRQICPDATIQVLPLARECFHDRHYREISGNLNYLLNAVFPLSDTTKQWMSTNCSWFE